MSRPTHHIDRAGSAFSRKTAKPCDQFTASNHSIKSQSPTQAYRLFRNTLWNSLVDVLVAECLIYLLVMMNDLLPSHLETIQLFRPLSACFDLSPCLWVGQIQYSS